MRSGTPPLAGKGRAVQRGREAIGGETGTSVEREGTRKVEIHLDILIERVGATGSETKSTVKAWAGTQRLIEIGTETGIEIVSGVGNEIEGDTARWIESKSATGNEAGVQAVRGSVSEAETGGLRVSRSEIEGTREGGTGPRTGSGRRVELRGMETEREIETERGSGSGGATGSGRGMWTSVPETGRGTGAEGERTGAAGIEIEIGRKVEIEIEVGKTEMEIETGIGTGIGICTKIDQGRGSERRREGRGWKERAKSSGAEVNKAMMRRV
jgi:hypothetical protein